MRLSTSIVMGGALLGAAVGMRAGGESDEAIALDAVPPAVLDAVRAKFPQGELKAAEKETEDGVAVYEIELTEDDRSIDVLLTTAGVILEIERELRTEELPAAVRSALDAKYPGATIEEAEEVTEFEEADEEEEDASESEDSDDAEEEGEEIEYEVEITTADGTRLEVEVSADGSEVEAESADDAGEAEED